MSTPVCVVPALVWPSVGLADELARARLPGLAALLSQATLLEAPAQALESWLAEQFGIAQDAPLALMRLAGESRFIGEAPELDTGAAWLCADPVALTFARENLLLTDPASLGITAEETAALIDALNHDFADVGRFYAATPTRWYVRLTESWGHVDDIVLPPLDDVVGRPVALFQPEGPDAARWARLANELQVFCYNHSVNATRESTGKPPLNALWLWGNGRLPQTPVRTPSSALSGDHPMLRGLVRLAGQNIVSHDKATWQLHDDLLAPAMQRDPHTWLMALQDLDARVLAPLAQALSSGRMRAVTLVSPCDHALVMAEIMPRARWQFWRRDLSPVELAQRLTRPERRPRA
ncbi:MAG: hypothetical protein QM803_16345 [Rhodocyclaceae bacterium]